MIKNLTLHFFAAIYFLGLRLAQTKSKLISSRYKNKNVKIISCGNLVMGGAGKTPFVGWLSEFFKQHHMSPAVLTRGYKRKTSYPITLDIKDKKLKKTWYYYGDEPSLLFLKHKVTIFIDKNKKKAAAKAALDHNVLIIDDGFQQLSIDKDIDFLLFDATTKLEKLKIFPLGVLREPFSHLSRADAFIITKSNLDAKNAGLIKNKLTSFKSKKPIFNTKFLPSKLKDKKGRYVKLSTISNQTCNVILGIANFDSFLKTAKLLNVKIGKLHNFKDHHAYQKKELQSIIKPGQTWLTSEKDAVRLNEFFYLFDVIYVVEMAVVVNQDLKTYLNKKLNL